MEVIKIEADALKVRYLNEIAAEEGRLQTKKVEEGGETAKTSVRQSDGGTGSLCSVKAGSEGEKTEDGQH